MERFYCQLFHCSGYVLFYCSGYVCQRISKTQLNRRGHMERFYCQLFHCSGYVLLLQRLCLSTHFENSVEPKKTYGALLLSTVKKCFITVPLVIGNSKFSTATFSVNEKINVKASLVNGGFSECKLTAALCGESQLKAC